MGPMVRTTLLRLSTSQRRSVISSLFTATFVASIITVAASQILPCPAKKRHEYYADNGSVSSTRDPWMNSSMKPVEKKSRRWIEEKTPGA